MKNIEEGLSVDRTFVLKSLKECETRSGDTYFKTTYLHEKGSLEGRIWDLSKSEVHPLEPGDCIEVEGTIEEYKGDFQLSTHSIEPSDKPQYEYLPKDKPYGWDLVEALEKRIETLIEAEEIKEVVRACLSRYDIEPEDIKIFQFCISPAASFNHDARVGGLGNHSIRVANRVYACAGPRVSDKDLAVAGAFLHDIGKIFELEVDAGFKYSYRGDLESHITMGTEYVTERVEPLVENGTITESRLEHLRHIILSHHGKKSFGSPVEPKSIEAMLVSEVDGLDTQIQMAHEVKEESSKETSFLECNRPIGNKVLVPENKPEHF